MIHDPLRVYLDALFASARPATLVELRWRAAPGMRRKFIPAGRLGDAAKALRVLGAATDVYVGVLPRWRPKGGRADVVGDGRTVWVDLDMPDGLRALEPIDPAPSLVVASGAEGHVHAYWTLRRAVPPRVIERANSRLAYALGGDLRAGDAARILRPPGTANHKHDRPVQLVRQEPSRVALGALVGGLADRPGWSSLPLVRRAPAALSGLDALPPELYVQRLTGRTVGRSRKVRCPLHQDDTPSLHVYPDAQRGWFCFGCGRGGTVYDLAAGLWDRELRGPGFAALRADLQALLLG
jgi:hypothetical protein